MTMPSSISQSSFSDSFGTMVSSFGPQIDEVCFQKITGSFGTGRPASAAWSE